MGVAKVCLFSGGLVNGERRPGIASDTCQPVFALARFAGDVSPLRERSVACRAVARGTPGPPSPYGLRRLVAAACQRLLSLRERRLVGGDGFEPPTLSV